MFDCVRGILGRRFTEREAYEHAVSTYTTLRKQIEGTYDTWSASDNVNQQKDDSKENRLREAANSAATDLADVRRHYQDVINVTVSTVRAAIWQKSEPDRNFCVLILLLLSSLCSILSCRNIDTH